ncbi:hypothetical protein CYLTODRAFT_456409 [Cylindrobasidium torrendii FP15055 ss-10]|uniref:Uncharacterized protein n=1 Tax=Cylindrobasidium torrendii FP15055 ss-10 TaxID=1314674 RepID=A0A0D7B4D9_9AGAR|nr:hypothetical protein CYLTODRAFT_456409 [Cylindrobasidium torrendii FP15055 ss-10]
MDSSCAAIDFELITKGQAEIPLLYNTSQPNFDCAQAAVVHQLQAAAERERSAAANVFGFVDSIDVLGAIKPHQSLVDNFYAVKDLVSTRLPHSPLATRLPDWTAFPYSIRCIAIQLMGVGMKKDDGAVGFTANHDNWIMDNEEVLRSMSHHRARDSRDVRQLPWTYGLVPLDDLRECFIQGDCRDIVIKRPPNSNAVKTIALMIYRPGYLDGFHVLDEKVKPRLYVQSTMAGFRSAWHTMTRGILTGLDWGNVFSAGGMVLGTMLTPPIPHRLVDERFTSQWESSDIDLYIYGLSLEESNKKIQEIARVYRANLPSSSPFLVARNSQTITFYSVWYIRRVQIVLKLVKNPREVLLNFDLDPCAIGYDGTNVWMLPRFVRALETGYTNFTMDLIDGHSLGDRKASQDDRVFKYAKKGFGIRFTETYLKMLLPYGTTVTDAVYLEDIASQERKWAHRCIGIVNMRSRKLCAPAFADNPNPVACGGPPETTHLELNAYMQHEPENGESCLNNFSIFMRHVALWEEEIAGNIMIREPDYAHRPYGELLGQANVPVMETPRCSWDSNFSVKNFRRSIDALNKLEATIIAQAICDAELPYSLLTVDDPKDLVKRITYTSSIERMFQPGQNPELVVLVTKEFAAYANGLVLQALADAGFVGRPAPLHILKECSSTNTCLVSWRLDGVLNWQMLDRRIDEVREVLWIHHHKFQQIIRGRGLEQVMMQANKRLVQRTRRDEGKAFYEWAAKKPYQIDIPRLPFMGLD